MEGNTLDNRYRWKESVGPMEERRVNWSRWSVHDTKEECGYKTPFPIITRRWEWAIMNILSCANIWGPHRFPVMNVGLARQYQSTQKVALGQCGI